MAAGVLRAILSPSKPPFLFMAIPRLGYPAVQGAGGVPAALRVLFIARPSQPNAKSEKRGAQANAYPTPVP